MIEDQKPARRFIAKSILTSGGFRAQWAAPGLVPAYVMDRGRPAVFDDEDSAENAARFHLFNALNKARDGLISGKPERYRKMTASEGAIALAEAGLTPSFFAFLYGTSRDRVLKWIDGVEDWPHPARLLLEIFKANPSTIGLAEAVTDSVTEARKPRKDREEG